jgi:hypothetical protein
VALGILQGLPGWSQVRCFLDLGAGSECLAVSLAEQHPKLKVRVFELPLCAKNIEAALLPIHKEHIQVIAGDYNEADIVGDNDVIWTSMSLYYAKDLNMLLSNLKAALSKNGMLVSLHEGLTDARTSPEYHVVGRFFPVLNGNNVWFGRGDIADTMRSVGFNKLLSRTIHTLYGPMDLDIAYC